MIVYSSAGRNIITPKYYIHKFQFVGRISSFNFAIKCKHFVLKHFKLQILEADLQVYISVFII